VFDPMDLLMLIGHMTMRAVSKIEFSSLVADDYDKFMVAIKAEALAKSRAEGLPAKLVGCICGHKHAPLPPEQDLFVLSTGPEGPGGRSKFGGAKSTKS